MTSYDASCTALVLYNPVNNFTDPLQFVNSSNSPQTDSKRQTFVGLSNQGATCYMNSLLQVLYMTPEFRRALYMWNYNPDKDGIEEFCIPLQLQKLFGKLQLSKNVTVDTVALTKSFGWEGSEVFQQQDVQELCRVLFDALEETFKGTEVENIIDELYAGELIDYVKCIDVDYQSERKDKFLDFSLAIKQFGKEYAMHSLTDCIEYYLQPELMDGDNKYFVETINEKVDAIKGLKFHRLPEILSIQLKRFVYEFNGNNIIQKKLNDQVRFPLILDMNKYVANSCKLSTSKDLQYDINYEFEKFLQDKIYYIKHQRQNKSKDKNGVPDEHDDDDGNDDVDMEDDSIPDLVRYDGIKAPDQIQEEQQQYLEEISIDEIKSLLQKHGCWVYELFGVLIHSGAISGGHYYAYIKDLQSTWKWYNFNDSFVTEIPESQVQEAWGGRIKKRTSLRSSASGSGYSTMSLAWDKSNPSQSSSLFTPSAATTTLPPTTATTSLLSQPPTYTLSNANAYMLLYHKVKLDENGDIIRHEFPADELVPEYIRQEIKRLDEEERQRKLEEEIRDNRLEIRIIWKEKEYIIITTKKSTYNEFLFQIWKELEIYKEDDIKPYIIKDLGMINNINNENTSAAIPEMPFHLFRLRFYNSYYKIPQDVYDVEIFGNSTLKDMKMIESRILYLESKKPEEVWEPYERDGSTLLLIEYDEDNKVFKPTRYVRVGKGATLLDLRQRMKPYVSFPVENIRFMKIIDGINFEVRCDELIGENKRLRDDLWLYDMQKIYFENHHNYTIPIQESPAKILYSTQINRLLLRISRLDGTKFEHTIQADRRWTITKLRENISESLSIPPYSFRMLRQHSTGQEIKDTGQTLHALNLYNEAHIALVSGEPLRNGQYYMNVILFTPTYPSGVKQLTLLDDDEEDDDDRPQSAVDGGNHHDELREVNDWNDSLGNYGTTHVDKGSSANSFPSPLSSHSTHEQHLTYEKEKNSEDEVHDTNGSETVLSSDDISLTIASTIEKEGVKADLCFDDSCFDDSAVIGVDDQSNMSRFAEEKVIPLASQDQFTYSTKIVVEHDLQVESLRQQVAAWLHSLEIISVDVSVSRLRLREKQSQQVGKILRDGRTLRQSEIPLYDGRNLVVQILEEPETLPPHYDGSVVLLVRKWERKTWTLGTVQEVLIPGSWRMSDISRCLAKHYQIRPKHARILVLSTFSEVFVCNLDRLQPCSARPWYDCTKEARRLNEMQFHLVDGDVLIIQDASEPLKELSAKEKQSKECLNNSINNTQTWLGAQSQLSSQNYNTSNVNYAMNKFAHPQPKTSLQNAMVTTGIKIKTLKDRQRESAEHSNSNSGTSSPDIIGQYPMNNGSNILEGNGGGVRPLSIITDQDEDDTSRWTQSTPRSELLANCNQAVIANNDIWNEETYGELTGRVEEVRNLNQAGGFALFEDIC